MHLKPVESLNFQSVCGHKFPYCLSWASVTCNQGTDLSSILALPSANSMISGKNLGFPNSSVGKESDCNSGDPGLIPESGRSAGEGNSYPLQYSGLENSTDSPWGCKESDKTWATFTFISLFKRTQPNPFSGKAGHSPWGHEELDTR